MGIPKARCQAGSLQVRDCMQSISERRFSLTERDNKNELELSLFQIKACPGWVCPPEELLRVPQQLLEHHALGPACLRGAAHHVPGHPLPAPPEGNPPARTA